MTDCAAPRHADEPEEAEPHAHLCRPCKVTLKRDLHRLVALDHDLEQMLNPQSGGNGGGHGSGNGEGLPYHAPAAECQSQIKHDLGVWVRWISSERTPDNCPVRTVAAMAGWITGQLRWCTFRPWSGDMAEAFASNRATAMAIIDPKPRAEITIPAELNYCPRCTAVGTLAATIYQAPGDKRESVVACGACEYDWPVTSWLRLGKTIITCRETQRRAA